MSYFTLFHTKASQFGIHFTLNSTPQFRLATLPSVPYPHVASSYYTGQYVLGYFMF